MPPLLVKLWETVVNNRIIVGGIMVALMLLLFGAWMWGGTASPQAPKEPKVSTKIQPPAETPPVIDDPPPPSKDTLICANFRDDIKLEVQKTIVSLLTQLKFIANPLEPQDAAKARKIAISYFEDSILSTIGQIESIGKPPKKIPAAQYLDMLMQKAKKRSEVIEFNISKDANHQVVYGGIRKDPATGIWVGSVTIWQEYSRIPISFDVQKIEHEVDRSNIKYKDITKKTYTFVIDTRGCFDKAKGQDLTCCSLRFREIEAIKVQDKAGNLLSL